MKILQFAQVPYVTYISRVSNSKFEKKICSFMAVNAARDLKHFNSTKMDRFP